MANFNIIITWFLVYYYTVATYVQTLRSLSIICLGLGGVPIIFLNQCSVPLNLAVLFLCFCLYYCTQVLKHCIPNCQFLPGLPCLIVHSYFTLFNLMLCFCVQSIVQNTMPSGDVFRLEQPTCLSSCVKWVSFVLIKQSLIFFWKCLE